MENHLLRLKICPPLGLMSIYVRLSDKKRPRPLVGLLVLLLDILNYTRNAKKYYTKLKATEGLSQLEK